MKSNIVQQNVKFFVQFLHFRNDCCYIWNSLIHKELLFAYSITLLF